MKDVTLHCKITILLLAIFPISAMIGFAICTLAIQVPLHQMAIFACFWSLFPGMIQLVIFFIFARQIFKDEEKFSDMNQWWSIFGIVSSMCFHFYAVYLSVTVWTGNSDKCFDNGRQCTLLTLLFEFIGFSWIAMMGLAYHSCFKKILHSRKHNRPS
uniref:MARVEL domain-containing protein n=1 Tax=Panagrolaimus sp. JU765 TaxID=591449 RepID=A0AC34R9R7_9BILA